MSVLRFRLHIVLFVVLWYILSKAIQMSSQVIYSSFVVIGSSDMLGIFAGVNDRSVLGVQWSRFGIHHIGF